MNFLTSLYYRFFCKKKLEITGILETFSKPLADLTEFSQQAMDEQNENMEAISTLEVRQAVLGDEIEQAYRTSQNLKNILGV